MTVGEIAAQGAAKRPAFDVSWHPSLMQYASLYTKAANLCKNVEPCMLAAITNRESGGRNVIQAGTNLTTMLLGDGTRPGVGVCQITAGVDWTDLKSPKFETFELWDPLSNITVAARFFLQPGLDQFPNDHRAAFDSFNLGGGGVQQEIAHGVDPNALTTGGNYGITVFTDWINFTAVSIGAVVDWTSFNP
jgi:hypothetical protein